MAPSYMSPATETSSTGSQSRQASTHPSSPMNSPADMENRLEQGSRADDGKALKKDEEDDIEDMDVKAKALTNLLKTSSVSDG